MSQSQRAYFYRIAATLVPLLVLLGVLTLEMSGPVLALVAAAFAVAEPPLITAARHTPTKAQ